jgi:RNA polymerase sigma factor (sigma-70 family)
MSNRRIDSLLSPPPDDSSKATPLDVPDGEHPAATDVPVSETVEAAYQRLYPRLVRLAYLLVDTTEQAEEAVQDAFAKAFPKWTRIVDPDAYIRTAVVNTCRRVQRRRLLVRRTPPLSPGDAVLGADHIADVVVGLPMSLRQVVVLRYYLQFSDAEIAETLKMPLGTVKSTLHRARALLREELS